MGERRLVGADGGLFQLHRWRRYLDQAHRRRACRTTFCRCNVTISPSDSKRIYVEAATQDGRSASIAPTMAANTGCMRPSDDTRPEERIGGGDLPVPMVDPKDPDTVYVASVVTWKSTDAGKTWTGFRGSPGGDDYQNVFVNPNNTNIIALASDQGVIISQNGGETGRSGITRRPRRCIT